MRLDTPGEGSAMDVMSGGMVKNGPAGVEYGGPGDDHI